MVVVGTIVPETATVPVIVAVPETETEPTTVADMVCVGASHTGTPVIAACVAVVGTSVLETVIVPLTTALTDAPC